MDDKTKQRRASTLRMALGNLRIEKMARLKAVENFPSPTTEAALDSVQKSLEWYEAAKGYIAKAIPNLTQAEFDMATQVLLPKLEGAEKESAATLFATLRRGLKFHSDTPDLPSRP